MTPDPSVAIGLFMDAIVTVAKAVILAVDIGLRIGLAVVLAIASPFLWAFMASYQEYPLLAAVSAAITVWLLMRIFLPRRFQ